ncbi:hypothetical protein J7E51_27930 [Priestia megaterium]|nr:hypothetical protein [Priestia megaterium]
MEKVKKIKNFLLSKVKSDLSDKAPILSQDQITQVVNYNLSVIDDILLDVEGITYEEYVPSSKQHKFLRDFISFLASQGFSQVREEYLSTKYKISRPTLRVVIEFLLDLGIIHKLKNRRKARIAPTVYVLVLHPNYLDNLKYLTENFSDDLTVSEVYTDYFTKDFTELFTKGESQTPCESKAEPTKNSPNKVNEVKSLKDNIIYKQEDTSADQTIEFKEYYIEKEKYAAAQGVPTDIINKLNTLDTNQIIDVWKSISRTLAKYGLNSTQYLNEILESCELAISAYYHYKSQAYRSGKNPQFNFAGCICGKLKRVLYQQLKGKMDKVRGLKNPILKANAKVMLGLTDTDERAVLTLFKEFKNVDKGLDELGVY